MAKPFRPFVCLSLLILFSTVLNAQTPPPPAANLLKITNLEAEEVNSPQYDVAVRGLPISRDGRLEWLQVKLEYATAQEWTDEVTFTFYVALRGDLEDLPEGASPTNVFSGTVTVVNVPKENDHEIDMFLDPYTFLRYGEVFAVAVEVQVDGRLAEISVEPESLATRKWWETETPNAIQLLSRFDSPFRMIEIDKQGFVQP